MQLVNCTLGICQFEKKTKTLKQMASIHNFHMANWIYKAIRCIFVRNIALVQGFPWYTLWYRWRKIYFVVPEKNIHKCTRAHLLCLAFVTHTHTHFTFYSEKLFTKRAHFLIPLKIVFSPLFRCLSSSLFPFGF